MKAKIVFLIVFASLLLVACSGKENTSEANKNESVNIKELVHDYSTWSIKDQTASITSTQLIVTDEDDNETLYDLPDDEFFVSIAPYINETHP